MCRLYARKCDALARSLVEWCEPYARFQRPRGGFFLWLECLNGLDAARVARAAVEEGVFVVPGRNFYHESAGDDAGAQFLRLAFSTASPEALAEAGQRLARAFARVAE